MTTYCHFTICFYEQFHIFPSRIRNFVLQRSWELHISVSMCNRHFKLNSSKLSPRAHRPLSPSSLNKRQRGNPILSAVQATYLGIIFDCSFPHISYLDHWQSLSTSGGFQPYVTVSMSSLGQLSFFSHLDHCNGPPASALAPDSPLSTK